MRILVTGGNGNVGRPAVARLVRSGHEVRVIGRAAGQAVVPGAEYRQCDVTDFEAVQEQVQGMEGVVHLAGIPHPALGSAQDVFGVNCAGTFNVYEAAAQVGIERVVCASSIQVLGYTCGVGDFEPHYFPIDEEHPAFTTDPYAFSKQIIEEIGAYYWRRERISGVCLRLPIVCEITESGDGLSERFLAWILEAFEAFHALPGGERRKRVETVISACDLTRAVRAYEIEIAGLRERLGDDAALAFARFHLWAVLDARDSAQAIEKALTAVYEGSHALFVSDHQNLTGTETEALADLFYPGVRARKRLLDGAGSFVSSDKAKELIGFEPEYSFVREFASARLGGATRR
jgi:nucleoside-diphosphate-sugar epimerase